MMSDGERDKAGDLLGRLRKLRDAAETEIRQRRIDQGLVKSYQKLHDLGAGAWKGVRKADADYRVSEVLGSAAQRVNDGIRQHAGGYLTDSEVVEHLKRAARTVEDYYGEARSRAIGERASEHASEPEALLRAARAELVRLSACILQVSHDDASQWLGAFGKLVSAKVAGAAGTGATLGLVSMFGTAGTGTAIGTLSGAASTGATLAWVGGLVGGGMAAGAVLTAGLGIAIGLGTYQLLKTNPRAYEELAETDRRIIDTAATLVGAIDQALEAGKVVLLAREAAGLHALALRPLSEELHANADDLASRLDATQAVKFRQHVLRDFDDVAVSGFERYARAPELRAEGLIGGTLYELLAGDGESLDEEQLMVLDALRRSTSVLNDASVDAAGDYLRELSPEQLRGVASNVKGIYHEMRWAESYNESHTDTFARLAQSTTQAGHDVELVNPATGMVIERYQLKATDDATLIGDHHLRYPDIDVFATVEVAARTAAASSGHSNADLTDHVAGSFEDFVDAGGVGDTMAEAGTLSLLATAGREAILVLSGQRAPSAAVRKSLETASQSALAAGVTAYLFG